VKFGKQNISKKVDDKYNYIGKYWEEREERIKAINYKEEEKKNVEEVVKAVEKVSLNNEEKQENNQ